MKKFTTLIVFSLLMILGEQALAQGKSAMFLGASFPMGNYGMGDIDHWVLTHSSEDTYNAAASVGFNVGLKFNFGVGLSGLSVMLSVDGFLNGLNNNMKQYFEDRNIELKNNPDVSSFSIDRPRYFNVPVMVGLNYVFNISPLFGIYVEGGAGANARFITSYYEAIRYVGADKTTVMNYDYKSAFSFAYQVGAGFEISKALLIGASFYDLGASMVTAERTLPDQGKGTDLYRNEKGLRPRMILVRIGFRF